MTDHSSGTGGGPTTEDGMLFQNSVTALYLGRLVDPRRPEHERVIQVRAEAPEHVDDTVVYYQDGHREWIQAKIDVRKSSAKVDGKSKGEQPPWNKLWQDFEDQRRDQKFSAEDRIVLAVGSPRDLFFKLRKLCELAKGVIGSEDAEAWVPSLSKDLQELLENIQTRIPGEYTQQAVLELLARVDVKIWPRESIEEDKVLDWMPESNSDQKTLFRLLRDRVGGTARVRGVFHPSVLLRELQYENRVEIKGHELILKPFEPETILVDAGAFLMGCNEYENEAPQRPITLQSYWIGKYPVTNAEYAEFIRRTGSSVRDELGWDGARTPPEQMLHHPVKGVTFFDALEYCRWLAEYTTRAYRLPTEAEWEKAARGTDGSLYPWGNDWEDGRCNYGQQFVTPADAFPAQSVYGCHDMVGNVAEWTHSLWGEKWNRPDPKYGYPWEDDERNKPNDNPELRRVCRGGSHVDKRHRLRCSARNGYLPDWLGTDRKPAHGFRVALSF